MPSGSTCSSSSTANAIKVTQTATVPMTFMKLFGKNSMTISASSMASMQGNGTPWNVAVILDGTGSMSDAPSSGSCSGFSTEFACALNGVKTLLGNVNSQGNFHVALFSFPNVSASTVSDFWTCGGTPTHENYTFPATDLSATTGYEPLTYGGTGASPTVATTYEDTPVSTGDGDANGFVTDYYSAAASDHLNSSSDIVKALNGCLTNPGGENTYYAGVIYAAQAALEKEHALNSGKSAIIMLSDGQANQVSSDQHLAIGSPTGTYSADGVGQSSASASTGWYPSYTDQCQQAILAAQAAQNAGTTVYGIAFGSEASGCGDGGTVVDTTSVANYTGTSTPITVSSLTPCVTMKNIASPAASDGTTYFYADTSSSSNGCTDTAHSVTNIADIFFAISSSFTTPRLLPTSSSDVTLTTTN